MLSNSAALLDSTVSIGTTNGIIFNSAVTPHAFTIGGLSGSANQQLTDNGNNAVALTIGNNNAGSQTTRAFSPARAASS